MGNDKTLKEYDSMYQDYNQNENESNIILEENGHPNAKEYRILRNFFDKLNHYSNSSARFYTFKDADNNTSYWAPSLNLRDGFEVSKKYIESLKNPDFYIMYGSWIVETSKREVFDRLLKLEEGHKIKLSYGHYPSSYGKDFNRPGWFSGYNYYQVTIYLDSVEEFEIVKNLIDTELKEQIVA